MQRLDGAKRHFAELIAQKQRLQQLESEYALKIQKLKEAQALRNKSSSIEPPSESPLQTPTPRESQTQPPPVSPFPVSQPSLHDLTQDKLTLDDEDIPETDESESVPAAAASRGNRRNSFRQSTPSTRPNLEQLASTPAKDCSTPKQARTTTEPSETFAGLDVDSLKQKYQQQPELGELLQTELEKAAENLETSPPVKQVKHIHYSKYCLQQLNYESIILFLVFIRIIKTKTRGVN